ncbi:NAD-dependent epimerase/dehydratase family protein [Halobacteria archaeon AArc-curdl1]|uniref:NAD-dependent epimerase/dehydratase family protein n=1 Tax=Natronosalvus hydrolyticus TaxID=2979988 RepID=A0AAP2ZBL2_9EURY|nr:NAD-dependent epimerase/dehydratase family protein [Halobacteria archaeon AArc-curdl1]
MTPEKTAEPALKADSLEGKRILVTGGGGFIGSHLVDALVSDNDVRVLDRFSTGTRDHVHDEATIIEGDVRDEIALQRAARDVDIIFHHAAIVSVEQSIDEPRASHAVNLEATHSVLEQARIEDARVVLASSAAVYGHPSNVPVAEGDSLRPTSPYGVQKLALDQYARVYRECYDLEAVALRYFNVYGPRQQGPYSGVISTFFEQARSGEPITIKGDGEQTRDFVHVDDVVTATIRAASIDVDTSSLNVGTGTGTSILELASKILSVTGSDSPIVHKPPRPGDIRHSVASTTRCKRELDFEARIDLETGLQRMEHRRRDGSEAKQSRAAGDEHTSAETGRSDD